MRGEGKKMLVSHILLSFSVLWSPRGLLVVHLVGFSGWKLGQDKMTIYFGVAEAPSLDWCCMWGC